MPENVEPAIRFGLQYFVSIVCDDNDECIYWIVRDGQNGGSTHVAVLDLREGDWSRWKRLPSLPGMYHPSRCSSTLNANHTITYVIYMRKRLWTSIEWAFTVPENQNDCTKGKWECQSFSSRPFPFAAKEKKPPFYVQFQNGCHVKLDFKMRTVVC